MTTETETDFNRLLQVNLVRVFSERDPDLRLEAIAEIYASDAVLYEPGRVATGHAQIAQAVDALLANLPPQFVFSSDGPAVGHHGVARLRWSSGSPDEPAVVTGTDVAQVVGGRIQTLHVFLDPAQS